MANHETDSGPPVPPGSKQGNHDGQIATGCDDEEHAVHDDDGHGRFGVTCWLNGE